MDLSTKKPSIEVIIAAEGIAVERCPPSFLAQGNGLT